MLCRVAEIVYDQSEAVHFFPDVSRVIPNELRKTFWRLSWSIPSHHTHRHVRMLHAYFESICALMANESLANGGYLQRTPALPAYGCPRPTSPTVKPQSAAWYRAVQPTTSIPVLCHTRRSRSGFHPSLKRRPRCGKGSVRA